MCGGVCMFVCVFIQEHCVYMNSYLQLKIHNQTQFHVQMYMYTYVNMYTCTLCTFVQT